MINNIEEKIEKNVNLAELTTFKIGGPAKFFIEVTTKEELISAINWAQSQKEKLFFFSGGSNILINDQGVDGLVIRLGNTKLKINNENIIAGSGLELAELVEEAKNNKLSGLEWAVGIPGRVGGSVRGNAGAYGGCLADNIKQVEAYDLENKTFIILDKSDCNFSYRSSIFKEQNNLIIWQAEFSLSRGVLDKIKAMMAQYQQSRLSTQTEYPSAGCIFKNLQVDELAKINDRIYQQALAENKVKGGKLACGYILDLLGLKGRSVGGAVVGHQHDNFIVNQKQSKDEDVKKLINQIKQEVKEKFNIDLQEEVQYFGF